MEKREYILNIDSSVNLLGGKAGSLAELSKSGFNVPEWFAVSPYLFYDSLSDEQNKILKSQDFEQITNMIKSFDFLNEFEIQLEAAIKNLSCDENIYFAVRSSGMEEDGRNNSFAGQFDSYLFVNKNDIGKRILDVWCSTFSEHINIYRKENKIEGLPTIPTVIVQVMIPAQKAGVAFAADPISGRTSIVTISAVYGVGNSLVSGEAEADTYYIDRENNIIDKKIATKDIMQLLEDGKLVTKKVEISEASEQILKDNEIIEIADIIRDVSKIFGSFQDIEWAYYNDKLYLLQSRPITSLGQVADIDGFVNLWDNSNIVESYSGITTPMTFSFIRRAYEEVYRQMCLILGVSKDIVDENSNTYKRMLGLIKGRVYYNLLSWYKVVSLLPGFKFNRKFMEQMMGVKEGIPNELLQGFNNKQVSKIVDFLRLNRAIIGLLYNLFTLENRIEKFYKRLKEVLKPRNVANMRLDELSEYYRELESKLLTKWDAPLINDFFAMIFYGLYRNVCEKWFDVKDKNFYNALFYGQGDIISAEPAKRVREMAHMILQDKVLIKSFMEDESYVIHRKMKNLPELQNKYLEYINLFGNRCLNELKLESPTLQDDPTPLFRSIGYLAERLDKIEENPVNKEEEITQKAEEIVKKQLKNKLIKKVLFKYILRNAKKLVKNRENLRFERTRLFGRVRLIVEEIGKRLTSYKKLEKYDDVFYLEIEEILSFVEGTATTTDLKGLVSVRKSEYENYKDVIEPDERFKTMGAVHVGNNFKNDDTKKQFEVNGDMLKGLGCCPGIVEGKVRIIRNPKGIKLNKGEILVAETTDPGWIMIFPAASGILVERGSLLSHSAIVSREMGIPAIVSLQGLTKWLKDGDYVKFDGSTGVVVKINEKQEEEKADERCK